MDQRPAGFLKFLQKWRKHRKLTQDQLAEYAGISKPFISQLENGTRQYTQETLESLARALDTDPPSLMARDPSDPDGFWAMHETLTPAQRVQAVAVMKALKTGTDE